MIISDNVVKGALRTSAADYTVGIQHRNSLKSVEHVRGEAKSSRCAGARAGYAPKCRGTLRARLQAVSVQHIPHDSSLVLGWTDPSLSRLLFLQAKLNVRWDQTCYLNKQAPQSDPLLIDNFV